MENEYFLFIYTEKLIKEFDDDGYNFFIEKSNIMNVDVPSNVKLLRQKQEYNI